MDIPALKQAADQSLANGRYPARRLALLHTAAALAVSLVLSLISFVVGEYGPSDGGLSGMGTQAALATFQYVLQIAYLIAMPFWQAGFLFAAMSYVRDWEAGPKSLLQGFRRFKPLLSSGLLRLIQYFSIGIVSMYLSSMLFMFTPFAASVYEAAAELSKDPTLDPYVLLGDSLTGVMISSGILLLLVFGVLAFPIFYRYRMVDYVILDHPEIGGIKAMYLSRLMMRRRKMELLKLDLSFWWYYGLQLLLVGIGYGDVILALAGVDLPVSDSVTFWLFPLLAAAGELVLFWRAMPKVEVTYAHCYEAFKIPPEPKPEKQTPRSHPWKD